MMLTPAPRAPSLKRSKQSRAPGLLRNSHPSVIHSASRIALCPQNDANLANRSHHALYAPEPVQPPKGVSFIRFLIHLFLLFKLITFTS